MVRPTESPDTHIFFYHASDMPIFFDQPLQDFNNNQSVSTVNDRNGFVLTFSRRQFNPPKWCYMGGNKFSMKGLQDVKSHGRISVYGLKKMYYMAPQAMCEQDYDCLHDSHLDLQDHMRHPIMFLDEMMGDIMYLHQVLQQPDARLFVEAVIKEVNSHIDNDHWNRGAVPEDTEVTPSAWAMQSKHSLTTGTITKHKARLNLHDGKQEFGRNYYNTYAPVVTLFAI
jgi:hypothetical protein